MSPPPVFRRLREGDTVGVIAPAGPTPPEVLPAVEALYARHGLRARLFPGCRARAVGQGGYLAGPDATRLADLQAALADDTLAALHSLRGGYGAMRLLPGLAGLRLADRPRLLIGYSDLTALHARWALEGLPSLHAPMPASDLVREGHGADADALFGLLTGGLRHGDVWAPALQAGAPRVPGVAEGVLIGGNLSLVAALLGTPWAWRAEGAILFLEDVSEQPYRVDRLLTQLRLAGVFDAVAGVLLGSFTEADPPVALLAETFGALGKPVLGGWPAGHGTPNRPLPMGLRVRLDATAGTLTMRQTLID